MNAGGSCVFPRMWEGALNFGFALRVVTFEADTAQKAKWQTAGEVRKSQQGINVQVPVVKTTREPGGSQSISRMHDFGLAEQVPLPLHKRRHPRALQLKN